MSTVHEIQMKMLAAGPSLSEMAAMVERFDPTRMAVRSALADYYHGEDLLQDALTSGAMANEIHLVTYLRPSHRPGVLMLTELQ